MIRILVLCTGNSCRSQMAEGYLRHFGKDRVQVKSAGLEAHGLNPYMLQVMKQDGIDMHSGSSNTMEEYKHLDFDIILTVCDHAKSNCPYWQGSGSHLHQSFKDPANAEGSEEEKVMVYTKVRDQIKIYCQQLINTI